MHALISIKFKVSSFTESKDTIRRKINKTIDAMTMTTTIMG